MLYPQTEKLLQIIIEEDVKIIFTSAGNPSKYTGYLKKQGITVAHVVANVKFAKKAIASGVDVLVAEGFEAGGHNGFEETTTLVLIPTIREICPIPLIAAGGIATGSAIYAAIALGADGVQIGSRFVASEEASAHFHFKQKVVEAGDGDTYLTLKQLVPVRLLQNAFFTHIHSLELSGVPNEILKQELGKGRAKKGMFEGDTIEGELEIGQVAGLIRNILPAKTIMNNLVNEFKETAERMKLFQLDKPKRTNFENSI